MIERHTSRRRRLLTRRSMRFTAVSLLLIGGIVFAAVRFGALSHLRRWSPVVAEYLFGPPATFQIPTDPDDLAVLNATRNVKPNVFGSLEEVLAVHPEPWRGHLLATVDDPHAMLLMARSWGLTKRNFTGDPSEIQPFLDYLQQPIDVTSNDDDLNGSADRGGARSSSLWAIAKAIASHPGYTEMHPDISEAATRHIKYRSHREYSLVILLMLRERGFATEEGNAAIEKALEHPLWRARFESRYDDIKALLASEKKVY